MVLLSWSICVIYRTTFLQMCIKHRNGSRLKSAPFRRFSQDYKDCFSKSEIFTVLLRLVMEALDDEALWEAVGKQKMGAV